MEMTYDEALVMPSNCAMMNGKEMTYVEGGSLTIGTICGIITAAIAVGGATYGAGTVVGQRLYYAGINSSAKWSKYKWQARATAIAAGGVVLGGIFITGLENKLYSMMS